MTCHGTDFMATLLHAAKGKNLLSVIKLPLLLVLSLVRSTSTDLIGGGEAAFVPSSETLACVEHISVSLDAADSQQQNHSFSLRKQQ